MWQALLYMAESLRYRYRYDLIGSSERAQSPTSAEVTPTSILHLMSCRILDTLDGLGVASLSSLCYHYRPSCICRPTYCAFVLPAALVKPRALDQVHGSSETLLKGLQMQLRLVRQCTHFFPRLEIHASYARSWGSIPSSLDTRIWP